MSLPKASREWQLTIENYNDHGFPVETIIDIIKKGAKFEYFCLSEEIGEKGTPHVHFYCIWESPMRFETLQNKFNKKVHIEFPNGTPEENRNYIFKIGKWEYHEKNHTNIKESHIEIGDCPKKKQGERNDLTELYELIKNGYSNYQIIDRYPKFINRIDKIDKVRKTILYEEIKNKWRDLCVTYVFGETGTGKTRSIMETFGYENVYRVTDYLHPFDGYNGQNVILFEEFRSSLKIDDMLKYLDGYPVELSCRYSNQMAQYTKVFFCTNIPLSAQYRYIQEDEKLTWQAFLRRIHNVWEYSKNGIKKQTLQEWIDEKEKPLPTETWIQTTINFAEL